MAINVDEISSDLTLEIDEDAISISEFSKAFDGFFGLVREASKFAAPTKKSECWNVKVYQGSAGIGVSGSSNVFTEMEINEIRESLICGVESLSRGIRPPQFSDSAIRSARTIARLFASAKSHNKIRLWSRRDRSVSITPIIAEHADDILGASYEADSSVDGVLDTIKAHDKSQFVVYDVIDDRAVTCDIDEALLGDAVKSFRKRVEVIGTVRYRKDGVPVSVKAEKIVPFPEKPDIPTLQQMRDLLAC